MGSLIQRFQNASIGKGWKTHEQRDRKYATAKLNADQRKGQEIIQALTPLSAGTST